MTNYTQLDNLECIVAHNKHGVYCVPQLFKEGPVSCQILKNVVYEEQTLNYIISTYVKGDIIHAGTFFGDFLPALSNNILSTSLIWAFEPAPLYFKCAQITIKLNNIFNVKLFNIGLGASSTNGKMITRNKAGTPMGGGSKIINNNNNNSFAFQIKIDKIDNIIPINRQISIIQLDIEGYEKNALVGAIKTIKRCKPILIIEDNKDLIKDDWFIKNILSLGYKFSKKVHDNNIFLI